MIKCAGPIYHQTTNHNKISKHTYEYKTIWICPSSTLRKREPRPWVCRMPMFPSHLCNLSQNIGSPHQTWFCRDFCVDHTEGRVGPNLRCQGNMGSAFGEWLTTLVEAWGLWRPLSSRQWGDDICTFMIQLSITCSTSVLVLCHVIIKFLSRSEIAKIIAKVILGQTCSYSLLIPLQVYVHMIHFHSLLPSPCVGPL